MPRLPSSLKWLIDRRARVAGEIEKIEALLAKCQKLSDELIPLKELLASVDQTLALHDITVDVELIQAIKSQEIRISVPHGELTRAILLCLKINDGIPCSTNEVTAFVAARFANLQGETSSMPELRESVRYRLKDLCSDGFVQRHHDPQKRLLGRWSLKGPSSGDKA